MNELFGSAYTLKYHDTFRMSLVLFCCLLVCFELSPVK